MNICINTIFFFRLFTFNSQQNDNDPPLLDDNTAADDVDIIIGSESNSRSHSINAPTSLSGNNILNSNLSGSFREENETLHNNRNSTTNNNERIPRTHRSAPNILQRDELPGTSRIGVAALLPTTNNQFLTRNHERNGFI